MSRLQQVAIGFIALLIIVKLTPSQSPTVMTNAPYLSASFSPLQGLANGAPNPVALSNAFVPTTNGLSVLGPPTISPEKIEAVLREYNSPAQGHGQEIYDLGVQYNINPAIMLAFFIHESGAGSNPAWAGRKEDGSFTHNIGNIICTEGWRCYGRFRDYDNWSQGIDDWYKLITELYIGAWGRQTVEDIIPRYAPASDNNDESAYINSVRTMVESWRGQ